jgi:MFS family permease
MLIVKEPPKTGGKKLFTVADNFKYITSMKGVMTAMISITFIQISITVAQPVFALFVESITMNVEYISTLTGAIFGTLGIFSVISSPWWGRRNDRKSFKKNIIIAIIGAGVSYILHTFVTNPYLLFPVRAMLGFFIGGIVPVVYAYINKSIADERKSGVMGFASSFTLLGNLIGPLLCTLLLYGINLKYIFLIAGLLMFINAVLLYYFVKEPEASNEQIINGDEAVSIDSKQPQTANEYE